MTRRHGHTHGLITRVISASDVDQSAGDAGDPLGLIVPDETPYAIR